MLSILVIRHGHEQTSYKASDLHNMAAAEELRDTVTAATRDYWRTAPAWRRLVGVPPVVQPACEDGPGNKTVKVFCFDPFQYRGVCHLIANMTAETPDERMEALTS